MFTDDGLDITQNTFGRNISENTLNYERVKYNKRINFAQLSPTEYTNKVEPKPTCSNLPPNMSKAAPTPRVQHSSNLDSSAAGLDSNDASSVPSVKMADKDAELVNESKYHQKFQYDF